MIKLKPYEYEKYNNVNIKEHLKNISINFDYKNWFEFSTRAMDVYYNIENEISENYDISRNAISKQINVIRDKLKDYENKLNLHTKKEKIYKALESTSDHAVAEIIKNII